MELSVVDGFSSNMTATTPKSARKRILFSGSPTVESGDESLGHITPLSSSPDRYSSPPPSPQWLLETPPRKCVASQPPIGPVPRQTESPKSRLCLFDLYTSSLQKLPLNKTQDSRGQRKGKMGPVTNTELVEESPMKGPIKMGLITPFKCLAGKDKQNEETPKQKSQKLVIEESPDIVSAAAPVKALQKPKPDYEASTVLKPFHAFTSVNKLSSLPTSSFYHSSRARAALFPEPSSMSRNTVSSVTGSKKRKRLPSAESYSRIFSLSRSKNHLAKRRKIGEINGGVYHRIKKLKKKKLTYKHPVDIVRPKIMPEDRVQSYLDKVAKSSTYTKNSVHNEKDVDFTSSHSVQPCLTGSKMKSSSSPLTPNTLEPICPASPPPDPTKKFFKTHRTMKFNSSATVTVDKNIKLKVSNGKFSLSKPETKLKSYTVNKVGVSRSHQNRNNGIFAENGTTEVMQETVRDNVEFLLEKLEESPKKDNLPAAGDVQSPNNYISSITTSTSSLAIHDDPLPQSVPQTSQTLSCPSDGCASEPSTEENQKESLFMDLQEGENTIGDDAAKENCNKYFPVFYKSSANETLADMTNVTKQRAKKRPWRSIGNNQYIIDAGQKKFGATQCKECCTVYQIGDPEDEVSHMKYHDSALNLKFTPWKHERVVAYYGTDKVILIKANDPKAWQNKVKNVMNVVDKELGCMDAELGNFNNSQIYLYVVGKKVTGCVVAHSITFAYKMLNSLIEGCDCCSEESYPAKCGVSRIWVDENYRRKKIASRLLDCVRSRFIYGYILGMDEFAFSAPTTAGKAFAEKYTGTMNYLVYT